MYTAYLIAVVLNILLASLVSQARLFTLATTTTSKLKKIINITGEEIEEGVVEDVKKPSAFPIAEKRI